MVPSMWLATQTEPCPYATATGPLPVRDSNAMLRSSGLTRAAPSGAYATHTPSGV